MALPLPDKIHNFYLMVQSAWAFWRTLSEIDVSHFRSTEDANYPLETLWGGWCNTLTSYPPPVAVFLSYSLSFPFRSPPLSVSTCLNCSFLPLLYRYISVPLLLISGRSHWRECLWVCLSAPPCQVLLSRWSYYRRQLFGLSCVCHIEFRCVVAV